MSVTGRQFAAYSLLVALSGEAFALLLGGGFNLLRLVSTLSLSNALYLYQSEFIELLGAPLGDVFVGVLALFVGYIWTCVGLLSFRMITTVPAVLCVISRSIPQYVMWICVGTLATCLRKYLPGIPRWAPQVVWITGMGYLAFSKCS